MSYALQVFVSSTCHDLRDLRAAIKAWLTQLGLIPLMSDESGFPHIDGMPPYATCLRALEECPLVIVVIDRRYGDSFQDWGPYPQFAGCSPTHAELRHGLDLGKRVLVYVHDDVWNFYEVWRKNRHAFETAAPKGLDEATLRMLHELKQRDPVPWMAHFSDVAELQQSLSAEFVNQLYTHLHEREKQTADLASYLLEKIVEAAPEVRERIAAGLDPNLVTERDTLRDQLCALEQELEKTRGTSQEHILDLDREKTDIQARLDAVTQRLNQTSLLLARAAMKDASWLTFVRTTMMPRQPGRVPFHNSREVALRGYHAASGNCQKPVLQEVTWSPLEYVEGGLHRGYRAGIIFRGSNFVPGATTTYRRRGEGLPAGQSDYFWRLPNIYFGDYLEIATGDEPLEVPLSWRDYEFQVQNPDGVKSEWAAFTYPFNDRLLDQVRRDSLEQGKTLLVAGKAAEAIEPLRKAYVFADRMLGVRHSETLSAKAIWEEARAKAALAKLRFREGARLRVSAGPHAGKSGIVERLLLNHLHAYVIQPQEGEAFQAADDQVDNVAGLPDQHKNPPGA
jgi:hypothetical protein